MGSGSATTAARASGPPRRFEDSKVQHQTEQELLERLRDWDEQSLEALGLLAIAGELADRTLLIHAGPGIDPVRAMDALQRAVDLGIVAERDSGGVRFTSEAIRDAVESLFTAKQVTSLHLAVAQSIERRDGGPNADNLVHLASHHTKAVPLVPPEQAAKSCLAAGELLYGRNDYEAAQIVLKSGLALTGRSEPSRLKADLLTALGKAQLATTEVLEVDPALATLEAAIDAYAEIGDIESALAIAGLPIPAMHGRETTVPMLQRALALAEEHLEESVMISIRLARAHMLERGDRDASRPILERAIERARAAGRTDLELRAIAARAFNRVYAMEVDEAAADAGHVLNSSTGDPKRLAELDACEAMINVELIRGNQEPMFELGVRIEAAGEWTGSASHMAVGPMVQGRVRMAQGRLDSALKHLARCRELQPTWVVPIGLECFINLLLGRDDEYERGRSDLLAIAPRGDQGEPTRRTIGFSREGVWALHLLDLSELTGDTELADRARLLARPPLLGTGFPFQQMVAMEPAARLAVYDRDLATGRKLNEEYRKLAGDRPLWFQVRGVATLADMVGEKKRSASLFLDGVRLFEARNYRLTQVVVTDSYLRLHAAGRKPSAQQINIARRAAEIAEEIGVVRGVDSINAVLEAGSRSSFAKAPELALTEREREVISLISGGRSNRQIADELHISPYTVDTHVRNLLLKLGVATRAEAAHRWVSISASETDA